jgi:poly(hydroxyalkanoate) granule-associated protein
MSHMASEISAKATGQWGKLESIFEERVAKALAQLGVPSAQEVQALSERVDALAKEVESLKAGSGGSKAARK